MAPAGVEPAPCRSRVGRSPLSYGAERDVAGRDRTCGAPRFKRPLYRAELRPRGMGEAGFEPATSCVLDKHSGQAELLVMMRSSGTRARTSVSAPLNNGVQSVASCRLDDPGKADGRRACPPSTSYDEVDAVAPQVAAVCGSFMARSGNAERCCPCHSPALRPWIASLASYVEGIWSPALLPFRKIAGKSSR